MYRYLLFFTIIILSSCQHNALRNPSSNKDVHFLDVANLEEAYKLNLELSQMFDQRNLLEKKAGNNTKNNPEFQNPYQTQIDNLTNLINSKSERLKNLEENLSLKASGGNEEAVATFLYDYEGKYRVQNEKLKIQNPENYKMLDGEIVRSYLMNLNGAQHYQLGLVNLAMKSNDKKKLIVNEDGPNDTRLFFDASLKCDADFWIKKTLFKKKIGSGNEYSFKIYEQSNESAQILLTFNDDINKCELKFKDPNFPDKNYAVNLVKESKVKSKLNSLRNKVEVCLLPNTEKLNGVEKFFLTPNFQSMTCSMNVHDVKTLEVPLEGLKAKAEALLGQPVPVDLIESKNPFGELDFSKAPNLNAVLVSYLVFREDFYGNLMARLIKWHADHGAQVKILVSDVIALKKDKQMLYGLQESSNNIKIQEYRYENQGQGLWDFLSEFHRTMHVKLLITLSDNPANNVVFFGGRNIHDGFVFKETPDYTKNLDMVQYGNGKDKDESYSYWRDFEMQVRSKELAERITSHLMTLWEKDSRSFFVRSINQNILTENSIDNSYFEKKDGALVRHFISIPYKDEHALDKFYADMIDSAQKSIRMSTPYFRPTSLVGAAMDRAAKRGVEISLITRIDLKGDTMDFILGEVNKEGINKFLNRIKILEYTEPNVILHSKLVLIDDKFSFIGSVNLNKRSFVHDTENGIMVYDKEFNQKMNSIMDTYLATSREVTNKQKVAFWKKVLIGVFDSEF